jgi:hypothetical protein
MLLIAPEPGTDAQSMGTLELTRRTVSRRTSHFITHIAAVVVAVAEPTDWFATTVCTLELAELAAVQFTKFVSFI